MHVLRLTERSLATVCALSLVTVASLMTAACRTKREATPDGRPAGSASSPAPSARAGATCRELPGTRSLTLGSVVDAPPSDEEGEVELPFAVELGGARAGSDAFAVGGLESRGGGSFAFVARVSLSGEAQTVELGRVHGDVEPPAVAAFGAGFVVALPSSDAGGVTLRLAAMVPPFTPESLRRGPELTGVRRDASGFALETSADRALLAFTQLDKGRGRVALAVIDPEIPSLHGSVTRAPESLAGADAELEAPRLAPRAAGYYLAYIARTPGEQKAARLETDAGTSEALLDEGPSAIEVVPLDLDARAVGPARRVTPPGAKVIAFELVATPAGGALVTYRDDQERPGLERPNLQAVHLRADGSFTAGTWEVGETPGLAALLVDSEPAKVGPWGWVALSDERATRLAALGSDPLAFAGAGTFGSVDGAELLAAQAGRFFAARVRGRQRELSIVTCTP